MANWLETLGFSIEIQPVPETRGKFNLLATLGSGRAVILLKTEEPREKEDELCVGIEADDGCEKRYRNTNILQLLCMKRDQCRQKSEITLPSSKPNVHEILWKSLEIRNLDYKFFSNRITKNRKWHFNCFKLQKFFSLYTLSREASA